MLAAALRKYIIVSLRKKIILQFQYQYQSNKVTLSNIKSKNNQQYEN